jgi:hypothetical protein
MRVLGHWAVKALAAIALIVVALMDAGSLAIVHVTVPDHAREAGRAAAQASHGLPATQQTALVAYEAAQRVADPHDETVRRDDFTVYDDGRVTLTVQRTAPTVLVRFVPGLRNLTVAETTATVEPSRY